MQNAFGAAVCSAAAALLGFGAVFTYMLPAWHAIAVSSLKLSAMNRTHQLSARTQSRCAAAKRLERVFASPLD